jgi:hypothetical protein
MNWRSGGRVFQTALCVFQPCKGTLRAGSSDGKATTRGADVAMPEPLAHLVNPNARLQ